ncbi:MAG: thioesterase family protein [Marinibacterium sp.]
MSEAFFREEDGVFLANDPARGPWSADHCHAGPVAGLAVRAAEEAAGPGKVLTRLSVDIVRPLPVAGLRVSVDVTRASRTLTTTRVEVRDMVGTVCMSGTTMHLAPADLGPLPTPDIPPPDFDAARPADWRLIGALHDRPYFGQFVDIAFAPGGTPAPGPKTIWMKTPAILTGEVASPIQSLCPLADSGNGISWNAGPEVAGFMNTDLTLQVHRPPTSDWIASDAVSHWHGNGVGLAQAVLYDRQGPVGVALQTLVLRPSRPATQ